MWLKWKSVTQKDAKGERDFKSKQPIPMDCSGKFLLVDSNMPHWSILILKCLTLKFKHSKSIAHSKVPLLPISSNGIYFYYFWPEKEVVEVVENAFSILEQIVEETVSLTFSHVTKMYWFLWENIFKIQLFLICVLLQFSPCFCGREKVGNPIYFGLKCWEALPHEARSILLLQFVVFYTHVRTWLHL